MPRTAKLFMNGRSQAVRLPSEFRFQSSEVSIRKDAATGEVILSSQETNWDTFFQLRDELTTEERRFEMSRDAAPPNPRQIF